MADTPSATLMPFNSPRRRSVNRQRLAARKPCFCANETLPAVPTLLSVVGEAGANLDVVRLRFDDPVALAGQAGGGVISFNFWLQTNGGDVPLANAGLDDEFTVRFQADSTVPYADDPVLRFDAFIEPTSTRIIGQNGSVVTDLEPTAVVPVS